MAGRRKVTFVVTDGNRDRGKEFDIEEMPATQAEEWCIRTLMLLARSGTDMPPDIFQQGAMGFVVIGMATAMTGLAKAPWSEVKPLMDEMMLCIKGYRQASGKPTIMQHSVILSQVEEPVTLMRLREEIISVHLGFSLRGRLSTFREAARSLMAALGPNTETSLTQSPSSSAVN
jgi:hypothetical protein